MYARNYQHFDNCCHPSLLMAVVQFHQFCKNINPGTYTLYKQQP